jgi:hypothetical protein
MYAFNVGTYDETKPLIIDPMLSTYLGGSGLDRGYALDAHYIDGLYVYVTGYTESHNDFPGLTGVQTHFGWGWRDAFVARLDDDLRVLNATYLRGSGGDEGFDITCHYSDHSVYVVGFTDSTNFPTAPGAWRGRGGGDKDGFVTRLTQDLSAIEESRYLGGSAVDQALSIVIDDREIEDPEEDTLYIVGRTNSNDFPGTAGSAQPTIVGRPLHDGFVARLNLDLSLVRASYLGGYSSDSAATVDIHPLFHEVYVAGDTSYHPSGGVTMGAFPGIDPASFGGQRDTFLVRMTHDLSTVLDATYLGGAGIEFCGALDINYSMHQVYIAGGTSPAYDSGPPPFYYNDFPANGFQTEYGGDQDAYVARFSRELTLEQSTYLGGTYFERAGDLVLDQPSYPSSDVYVLGATESDNLPGTEGGINRRRGGDEAFVALLNDDLTDLEQATYVGGSGFDESQWHGLALGNSNTGARFLFVTGETSSSDFPGVLYTDGDSTAQPVLGGSTDAFVSRLNPLLIRTGPPDIELQPRDYDFGNKPLNVPAFPRLTVTIENMGGDPLTVSDVFLTGTDQGDYEIDFTGPPEACGDNQPVVAPGEYCTVNVGFTPSVDNDYRTAELVVQTDNDPDEPEVRITLSGYSGPDIDLTPAQPGHQARLSFPATEIGTSTTLTFTVRNVGYSDLIVADFFKTGIVPFTGEDFTLHYGGGSSPCPGPGGWPFTLARYQFCTVEAEFAPTFLDMQEAVVIIISNDLDEGSGFVHLDGPGVVDLDANIWSHDLDFHGLVVGNSRYLPLVISNTGGDLLEITGFTLSDTFNFSYDPNGGAVPCGSFGTTIPISSYCTMTMTFNPYNGATFNETLTIHSNDPDDLHYTINLTGISGPDGDGVLDSEEAGDANNDGTPDSEQANVGSLHSYDGEHFVVMEAQGGATLEDLHPVLMGDSAAPGFSFPFGFYHFTIVLPPGEDSTTLTVTLPAGQTAETWAKHGPEPCNTEYHYYDFGDASRCPGAVDGVDISGNVITLHFTDGQDGDSDLTVNSRIVDPGAPALIHPTTTTTIYGDSDIDYIPDAFDNCPDTHNPLQEDTYPPQGNGIGDACDCECDFDCDGDVDADDVEAFLADFGRAALNNPCANGNSCNGDCECDTDVDADDVEKFLEDFARAALNNPCPACAVGNWCVYP